MRLNIKRLLPSFILLGLLLTVVVGCRQSLVPAEKPAKEPASSQGSNVSAADATAPTADIPAAAPTEIPPTPTPEPLPPLSFQNGPVTDIAAAAGPAQGPAGITLALPEGMVAEGTGALVTEHEIDPAWRAAIEAEYQIASPFFSLAAQGQSDSQGRVTLRLPADNPESILAVFIDNQFLINTGAEVEAGFLEAPVRLGPTAIDGVEPIGSLSTEGSRVYVLLAPKGAAAAQGRLAKPAPGRAACSVLKSAENGVICRQSTDHTVLVVSAGVGLTEAAADSIADAIEASMKHYQQIGFTAAAIDWRAPMEVVIKTVSDDPMYSFVSGNVYLPLDAAQSALSGEGYDTLHELAHWIQDEEVNMTVAMLSGSRRWWIEASAENMVMSFDPDYITVNAETYGISSSGSELLLQKAPYQWYHDFYIQGTLVRLNMCDDPIICPLSEASFISAVNEGSYPYADSSAQEKLSANLDAYAKYLLGAAPDRANLTMPLAGPVASGIGIGDYIRAYATNNSQFELEKTGTPPQTEPSSDDHSQTLKMSVPLEKDGVYPLTLTSGRDGRVPGMPYAIQIQPGAPLWYRLGDGAPQFHDGAKELWLQPVHAAMGHPSIRIVAMGKAGGELFQAEIHQIDLSGAWVFYPKERVGGDISCVSDSEGSQLNSEQLLMFLSFGSLMGDFKQEASGGYSWSLTPERLSEDVAAVAGTLITFEGAALQTAEDLKLQAQFEWQNLDTRAPAPARTGWLSMLGVVAMVLPGTVGWRYRRKFPAAGISGLLLSVILLAGCSAALSIYGTIGADMTFTSLEYVGNEATATIVSENLPEDQPMWKLSGTADYTVDFTTEATVFTIDGQDEKSETHCTGTATYKVDARVYKDVAMSLE